MYNLIFITLIIQFIDLNKLDKLFNNNSHLKNDEINKLLIGYIASNLLNKRNQFTNYSFNPPMIRKNKEYDDILMAFLTGKLLGDGFARKGSSKIDINATGTAFTFAQNIKQLEYIKNMYSLLLEYNLCSDRVPQIEFINTKELDLSKRNYKYSLYTTKNPEFDELFNAFYKYDPTTKHYVKGLYDKELISRYFNPFSLAIFTMDDGRNQNSNIKFCTDGFTKADTE